VVSDTNRLAYELSRSALTDQSERLSDLRTRRHGAGRRVDRRIVSRCHQRQIETLSVLALIAYLVSVGAAVYTLLPHTLTTEFRGTALLRVAEDVDATDDEAFEATVRWLEHISATNVGVLGRLTHWYVASAVALGIEVSLWTVALTT
jgi:hypothetical protein